MIAHGSREGRRTLLAVATAAAVVVALGVSCARNASTDAAGASVAQPASPSPSSSDVPAASTSPPLEADKEECGWGSDPVQRDVAPSMQPARLLSSDPSYELMWINSAALTPVCATRPDALVLTDADSSGVIQRSITIDGPSRTRVGLAAFAGPVTQVAVRGTSAELANVVGMTHVQWTEPDGRNWYATAAGVSERDLVAVLDRLSVTTGGTVSLADVGSWRVEATSPVEEKASEQAEWLATYSDGEDDGGQIVLYVDERASQLGESGYAADTVRRFTTIRGHRAVKEIERDGRHRSLNWEERPGIVVMLTATNGVKARGGLVGFANSLELVAADDPRIAAKLMGIHE